MWATQQWSRLIRYTSIDRSIEQSKAHKEQAQGLGSGLNAQKRMPMVVRVKQCEARHGDIEKNDQIAQSHSSTLAHGGRTACWEIAVICHHVQACWMCPTHGHMDFTQHPPSVHFPSPTTYTSMLAANRLHARASKVTTRHSTPPPQSRPHANLHTNTKKVHKIINRPPTTHPVLHQSTLLV